MSGWSSIVETVARPGRYLALGGRIIGLAVVLTVIFVPNPLIAAATTAPAAPEFMAAPWTIASVSGSASATTCVVEHLGAPDGPFSTGFTPPDMDLSYLSESAAVVKARTGVDGPSLPATWDWRTQGMVTGARDQMRCGCCYAFAAMGNVESRLAIDGISPLPDYSEKQVRDCSWYALNPQPGWSPCLGGNYTMVANYLTKWGTVSEASNPYTETAGSCPANPAYQTTMLGWELLSEKVALTNAELKQAIHTHGPVYTSMYAGEQAGAGDPWRDGLQTYDGSTVLQYTGTPITTDHAVLVVGWDDTMSHAGGQGAWIIKNSWGADWGDNGFFYLAYGADDGYGAAGVGSWVAYMTDWQTYDAQGALWFYDEAGWTGHGGYGDDVAWGANVFTATATTNVTRVEFWIPDAMDDVDVYLYDSFNDGPVGTPLWQSLDHSYESAGYHSVEVAPPIPLGPGDDIAAVIRFDAVTTDLPLAQDRKADADDNSWGSADGTSWDPMDHDLGIRLRVSTAPANVSLTKSVLGSDFGPGAPVTFTLSIANTGSGLAQGVVVTDVMPAQVVNREVTSTLMITETGNSDYVWAVEPLMSGATGTITVSGRLTDTFQVGDTFDNMATIYDPQDATPGNNSSTVTVGVQEVFLPLLLRNFPPVVDQMFYPSADTAISSGAPGANLNDSDYLYAGYRLNQCSSAFETSGVSRSLMKFDLSTLPVTTVKKATLYVRVNSSCGWVGAGYPTVQAYRVTSAWEGATVTWSSAPSFDQGYGQAQIRYDDAAARWHELDVTGLVTQWLQGTPNHGLMLLGHEQNDSDTMVIRFLARGTGYGPYLNVEYYDTGR